MSYSLNELGSLCKRATRGAGLSWGLCEEAARAARWLSSFGLPGPQMLAVRLGLLEGQTMASLAPVALMGEWHGKAGRLCPLITGAALSDSAALLAKDEVIRLNRIVCPLLLAPFAADVAFALETPVSVQWNRVLLTTDGFRLSVTGAQDHLTHEDCQSVECRRVEHLPQVCLTPATRGDVDKKAWQSLSLFANRTYAPATDESRQKGAG